MNKKQRDEKRNERLAFFTQNAGCKVRDIVDDAFNNRLALRNARRAVARADPGKENKRKSMTIHVVTIVSECTVPSTGNCRVKCSPIFSCRRPTMIRPH